MSGELHVVFGTGPLGLAVMRTLRERDARVRMVNRAGRAAVPEEVEVVAADVIADPVSARRAAQGAAVVYNCANAPYHRWPQLLPGLFGGILDAAAAAGARLVVGDNVYMYGEVDGPITDDLPVRPTTRKGRIRAEVAETMLAAHRAGRAQVAIGRASDFIGPFVTDGGMIGSRAIVPALRGGTASLVGNIDLPHTFTYIEDFGRALVILGERPEAPGRAWIAPSLEAVTQRALMTMVFEEMGRPPRMRTMGRGMLRLAGLFVPEARELVEMMYEYEKPFVVDGSRFERTFGLRATPLRDVVRSTVAWYRAHLGAVPL
jgi:nucleoside-diphosphate-sugar epimerase